MEQQYSIDTNRLVNDITGFVAKLKTIYFDCKEPIDDNEVVLQKLCVKLETAFRHGLRDKYSFLGVRKDYWNFFSESLPKDEGVRYVNSISQLHTPQGKGRALIRYCLVQKTLADTIQRTLMRKRRTEWYSPDALLLNSAISNTLISKLYDLNEMEFHLSCTGCDLDMSWPVYGRVAIDGYDKRKRRNSGGSIASTTDFANERVDPLIALNAELSTLKQFITKEFDKEKTSDDGIGDSSNSNEDIQLNISDATLEVSRLHQLILKWKSLTDSKVYKADMEIERLVEEKDRTSRDLNSTLEQERESHENRSKLAFKDSTMQITDLQNKLKTSEDAVIMRQATIKSLNSQKDEISYSYKTCQENVSALTEELTSSEITRTQLKNDLQKIREDLKQEMGKGVEMKQKCEELKAKMTNYEQETVLLRKQLEECETKLRIKTLEEEKLQEAVENVNGLVFTSFEDFDSFYKSQLHDKEKGLQVKNSENINLERRVSNLTDENRKLEQMIQESQNNLISVQSELELYSSKQDEEREKFTAVTLEVENLREGFRKINDVLSKNSKLVEEVNKDYKEVTHVSSIEQQCQFLIENLTKTKEQLRMCKTDLENVLQEKVNIETNLESVLLEAERLREHNNVLGNEKKRLQLDKEGDQKRRMDVDNQVRLIEKEKLEVENLLNCANEKNTCSENELNYLHEKLEEEKYLKVVNENELSETADELKTEKEEKANVLMELESLKNELSGKSELLNLKETGLIKCQNELTKMDESYNAVSSELENMRQKMDSVLEEKCKFEEKATAYQEQLSSLQCTMGQEVSSLKFQLSSEVLKYDDEIKELSKEREEGVILKEKIQEKEEAIAELEITLKERNENWQAEKKKSTNEIKLLKHEIKVLNDNVDMDKEEIKSMESTLALSKKECEKAKSRCNEYRKTIKGIRDQKSQKEDILEQKNVELEEDIAQLKSKLVSLLSDKSELWKRSNQLEYDMKNMLSDTWVEDKDVLRCPACRIEFTLFVRKHHCRLCGNVFCHTCSDHFVKTIHSRKPKRCCDDCYAREKELRADTSLTSSSTQQENNQRNTSTSSCGSDSETDSSFRRASSSSTPALPVSQKQRAQTGEKQQNDDDEYEVIEESEESLDSMLNDDLNLKTEIQVHKAHSDRTWCEVDMPPGKRCVISANVTTGSQLVIEFMTSQQNIFFAVAFKEMGKNETKTIVQPHQINSQKRNIKELPHVQRSGVIMFIFDNTRSTVTESKLDFIVYLQSSENDKKLVRS